MSESLSRAATEYLVREAGLRDHLHPDDAFASVHVNQAEYDAAARRNLDLGNAVHGPVRLGLLLVQIVDVTPALRAIGSPVTDPGLPDRISSPCCADHGRECEPPYELCCGLCTEADHPQHILLGPCSNPDLSPNDLSG